MGSLPYACVGLIGLAIVMVFPQLALFLLYVRIGDPDANAEHAILKLARQRATQAFAAPPAPPPVRPSLAAGAGTARHGGPPAPVPDFSPPADGNAGSHAPRSPQDRAPAQDFTLPPAGARPATHAAEGEQAAAPGRHESGVADAGSRTSANGLRSAARPNRARARAGAGDFLRPDDSHFPRADARAASERHRAGAECFHAARDAHSGASRDDDRVIGALGRTREHAGPASGWSRVDYPALRPSPPVARTKNRSPPRCSGTWSTSCWGVGWVTGRPQEGQGGTPMRAKSRRR